MNIHEFNSYSYSEVLWILLKLRQESGVIVLQAQLKHLPSKTFIQINLLKLSFYGQKLVIESMQELEIDTVLQALFRCKNYVIFNE